MIFFKKYVTASSAAPKGYTVLEDAGIKPKNVATLALALTTRPDLIQYSLDLIHHPAKSYPSKSRRLTCQLVLPKEDDMSVTALVHAAKVLWFMGLQAVFRIRIRIGFGFNRSVDPDHEGQKLPTKIERKKS